jgi:signal transduction histidine kinase
LRWEAQTGYVPYEFGNPYTLALLATAAFMFTLAGATYRHRNARVAAPLAGFLVAIGTWSLGDAVRIAAPTESAVVFWNTVSYAGIVVVPPTLLLFVLAYTGRRRWLDRRYVAGLGAISLAAFGVVVTNPVHGLWFAVASMSPGTAPPVLVEDWGPVWYAWVAYVYAIVVGTTYLMASEFVSDSRSGIHRVQTGLVLAGVVVVSVINVLFVAGLLPFDPTPFTFGLTGVAFGVATFRYQLLTVLPIARDTVLSTLDSGVLVLDADDRVVDTNERFRSMFDVAEGSVRGESAASLFADHPEIRSRLDSLDDSDTTSNALDSDSDTTDSATDEPDTISVETDGRTRHYQVEGSRLTDAVDTNVGRVVVFTDVTRQVSRRRRLRERTRKLERRNEQLDGFASVVSHDLRNPLAVVSAHADLAGDRVEAAAGSPDDSRGDTSESDGSADGTDDTLDATLADHLDAITDATERMETIVDDVLTLARRGEVVGETEPVALDAVARRAWALVDSDGANLSVETDATVRADPNRLQEVFENLFRNAVDHAGPEVHVRVRARPDGFVVDDDGPGIPPADRDEVFDAGYTSDSDGTGLGLNIVRAVVEAHGWTVAVTDSPEDGARFEVDGVERLD